MTQPVFRFAPSPNGYLHLGHALSALTEDLRWLGIEWDAPVRRQSEHLDAYRAALGKLEARGLVYPSFESRADIARLVAERDAKAHWPRDPDGAPLYPGNAKTLATEERARRIASGEPYALRLDMNAAIARTGALTWVEVGADPKQDHETLMAEPQMW